MNRSHLKLDAQADSKDIHLQEFKEKFLIAGPTGTKLS